MRSRSPYTLPEIASLLNGGRVLFGTNPQEFGQHRAALDRLIETEKSSPDTIAIQVLGAGVLSSLQSGRPALDVAVMRFETAASRTAPQSLGSAALHLAAEARGVTERVPATPKQFIRLAAGSPEVLAGLFERGEYHTPNMELGQLAVLAVLREGFEGAEVMRRWQAIRERHAEAYLGNVGEMNDRLAGQLGRWDGQALSHGLLKELERERLRRFGLPADVSDQEKKLGRWLGGMTAAQKQVPGWKLYQGVLRELKNGKVQ